MFALEDVDLQDERLNRIELNQVCGMDDSETVLVPMIHNQPHRRSVDSCSHLDASCSV